MLHLILCSAVLVAGFLTVDLAVVTPAARHCAEPGCRKCSARSRWLRRRAWRAHKSPQPTGWARRKRLVARLSVQACSALRNRAL
jgi:hypothetical protein